MLYVLYDPSATGAEGNGRDLSVTQSIHAKGKLCSNRFSCDNRITVSLTNQGGSEQSGEEPFVAFSIIWIPYFIR